MSWEHRHYAYSDEPHYSGGGMRSWVGGLPSPGKAVKWIALANIGLFVICLVSGGERSPIYTALEMRTALVLRGQIWRLVTFTYLHSQSDILHLLFNMIGLYFLGMPLERHMGTRRFFIFYTVTGLVAAAVYFTITAAGWLDPRIPIVGASGGVLGILGACAVLFPGMQIILIFFPVPIRAAALLFGVLYVFNLGTRGINAGGDACHLAGLAFGILYGYRGRNWERVLDNWRAVRARRNFDTKRREAENLQSAVDRILEKVREKGIASLSRREKNILDEATRRQRDGTFHGL